MSNGFEAIFAFRLVLQTAPADESILKQLVGFKLETRSQWRDEDGSRHELRKMSAVEVVHLVSKSSIELGPPLTKLSLSQLQLVHPSSEGLFSNFVLHTVLNERKPWFANGVSVSTY